ncbi:diacylglycerol kinase family protein [Hellea sp.]|nr:diacylglycerol kinase family protein [Hellea sp.]
MVCCALISIILAGLIWPIRKIFARFRRHKTPPLMWRLSSGETVETRPPSFSLSARLKSVSYAVTGIGFVIRNEHNARIHIAAALVVVLIGMLYKISAADWLILVLAITSVWFAETINTAFEYLCDVVSPQKNEAVRHAKDIAAGAVLITAIGAIIIGFIVMFPYIQNGFEGGL